ncbi:lytic polysaccharide monooxygenase [Pseudomonas syringae]|uniref:lytic polysaccharide monooxygenase n=1 Tax=Pseudomonas syringae TaxID=317 RepID=UPI001F3BD379|nr:lytic polysaccharide monooxygenase [Pseudomonas syringae]MCF5720528.1 chitin-binding protein [Pseudomonas syringae]
MYKFTQGLIKWTLAAVCLAPTLGWAHGALDTPPSRAVNCQVTGGFWQSQDGSAIVDKGCREASLAAFGTPAQWAFPFQQWHEVAHIPHINNPTLAQIQGIIKDGQICRANDPNKASLDHPTPNWTKTSVTPGQSLTMRLIGTAPHVPSKFYPFITRPGFNTATDVLKWSDLIPLGQPENFTVANKNWQTPPAIAGASGYFLITRPIPSNASGNGLIVGIWVRNDPAGEFFISCSDAKFEGGAVPDPLTNIGQFIESDMQALEIGDSVHFRVFGIDGARTELIDILQKISKDNFAPGQWGKQIADKVDPSVVRVGELQNQTVTFNAENPLVNSTYATQPGYTQAMSIIPGGGTTPVNPAPPVARISGSATLKSGEAFTFTSAQSTGHNGPLLRRWNVPGMTGAQDAVTVSGKADVVTTPTALKAQLSVSDPDNGKTAQAEFDFTVMPDSGGTHPDYKEGTAYKDGDIVTHNGKNYKCKPHPYTAWCAGAGWAYAPGSGTAWQQAWDEVQ